MNRFLQAFILFLGAVFFFGAAYWSYSGWQERIRIGLDSRPWPSVTATFEGGHVQFVSGSVTDNSRTNYQPRIR